MAYLETLEGESEILTDSDILDRLFDCNDALGVAIYGADSWNRLKSFAANLALRLLVAKRSELGKSLKQYYRSNHDVIDQAFGFNDQLGATLLGGEEWGHFVNKCKTAAPVMGSVWDNVTKAMKTAVSTLVPASSDPKDLLKWLTSYQGVENTVKIVKDATGVTASEEAAAKKQKEQDYIKRLNEEATAYKREAEQLQKQREADIEKAAREAEIEANKEAKIKLNTDPTYLASRTRNFVLFGILGLVALYIVKGDK